MGPNCGKCMEAEGVEPQKQAPAADRHAIPSPRQAHWRRRASIGAPGPAETVTAGTISAHDLRSGIEIDPPLLGGALSMPDLPLKKHAIRINAIN
jgi:hypothetical protein